MLRGKTKGKEKDKKKDKGKDDKKWLTATDEEVYSDKKVLEKKAAHGTRLAYHHPFRYRKSNTNKDVMKNWTAFPNLLVKEGEFVPGELIASGAADEDTDPGRPPTVHVQTVDEKCAACSTSCYGWNYHKEVRDGDPIADYFHVLCADEKTSSSGVKAILALADGSGWGKQARRAAKCAAEGSVDWLVKAIQSSEKLDSRTIATLLASAISEGHARIINDAEDKTPFHEEPKGATTLVLGVIIELKRQEKARVGDVKDELVAIQTVLRSVLRMVNGAVSDMDSDEFTSQMKMTQAKCDEQARTMKIRDEVYSVLDRAVSDIAEEKFVKDYRHAFVSISIGDCKAFRRCGKTGSVVEVTQPYVGRDVRLAGGQLGWTWDDEDRTSWPLEAVEYDPSSPNPRIKEQIEAARQIKGILRPRNTHFCFIPLRPKDQIFLMSDGVYDNFMATEGDTRTDDECLLPTRMQGYLQTKSPSNNAEQGRWSMKSDSSSSMINITDLPPALITTWMANFALKSTSQWRHYKKELTLLRKTMQELEAKEDAREEGSDTFVALQKHSKEYSELSRVSNEEFRGKPDHATIVVYEV